MDTAFTSKPYLEHASTHFGTLSGNNKTCLDGSKATAIQKLPWKTLSNLQSSQPSKGGYRRLTIV